MKAKILLGTAMLLSLLFLTGCGVYGKGQTQGYIYAVDDGLLWDEVWFKSSLQSSESDCYLIKDDNLKEQLRSLPAATNIKLYYGRHIFTWSGCPNGTDTSDEITNFEVLL